MSSYKISSHKYTKVEVTFPTTVMADEAQVFPSYGIDRRTLLSLLHALHPEAKHDQSERDDFSQANKYSDNKIVVRRRLDEWIVIAPTRLEEVCI